MSSVQKSEFKKGIMNIVDIIFACCHSVIIIFPLIVLQNNLVLEIMGIVTSASLLFLVIFTSITKNPFYMSYGIALLLSVFFYLIPSVILVPLIGIFLIPEISYIIVLTWKTRIFSASRFYADSKFRKWTGSYGLPPNPNPNLKLREGLQSEQVEKQYHAKRHVILSFIMLIFLVVIFFLWYNPSLLY